MARKLKIPYERARKVMPQDEPAVGQKTAIGYVGGRHFTAYVEEVKALKRAGRLSECESLLLKILDANEAQARIPGMALAPWWYEQLAIIYRKQKNYAAEVAVLGRHADQPGSFGLALRLHKAKTLLSRHQG